MQLHKRPPSDYDGELPEAWNAGPMDASLMEVENTMAEDPTNIGNEGTGAALGVLKAKYDTDPFDDLDDAKRMEY